MKMSRGGNSEMHKPTGMFVCLQHGFRHNVQFILGWQRIDVLSEKLSHCALTEHHSSAVIQQMVFGWAKDHSAWLRGGGMKKMEWNRNSGWHYINVSFPQAMLVCKICL